MKSLYSGPAPAQGSECIVGDSQSTQSGVASFHVITGPAVTYWSPANRATGDFTVKATFTEPKYMNLNSHPHPYGIFIAGNEMGAAGQSYLYCAAYGNGRFIVRGFGPGPFQMNGFQGDSNAAVHQAAGVGQPVTQEIALSVKGDQVQCSINGAVVTGYNKAALVTSGMLKSTSGIYGLRFAHNTESHSYRFERVEELKTLNRPMTTKLSNALFAAIEGFQSQKRQI